MIWYLWRWSLAWNVSPPLFDCRVLFVKFSHQIWSVQSSPPTMMNPITLLKSYPADCLWKIEYECRINLEKNSSFLTVFCWNHSWDRSGQLSNFLAIFPAEDGKNSNQQRNPHLPHRKPEEIHLQISKCFISETVIQSDHCQYLSTEHLCSGRRQVSSWWLHWRSWQCVVLSRLSMLEGAPRPKEWILCPARRRRSTPPTECPLE